MRLESFQFEFLFLYFCDFLASFLTLGFNFRAGDIEKNVYCYFGVQLQSDLVLA